MSILKEPMALWEVDIAGIGAGITQSFEINLAGYMNGRIRGSIEQDVAAASFEIRQALTRADLPGLRFGVTQDTDVVGTNFHYPFDVIVIQPYVRLLFTNGGAPSTLFRAHLVALPI